MVAEVERSLRLSVADQAVELSDQARRRQSVTKKWGSCEEDLRGLARLQFQQAGAEAVPFDLDA